MKDINMDLEKIYEKKSEFIKDASAFDIGSVPKKLVPRKEIREIFESVPDTEWMET